MNTPKKICGIYRHGYKHSQLIYHDRAPEVVSSSPGSSVQDQQFNFIEKIDQWKDAGLVLKLDGNDFHFYGDSDSKGEPVKLKGKKLHAYPGAQDFLDDINGPLRPTYVAWYRDLDKIRPPYEASRATTVKESQDQIQKVGQETEVHQIEKFKRLNAEQLKDLSLDDKIKYYHDIPAGQEGLRFCVAASILDAEIFQKGYLYYFSHNDFTVINTQGEDFTANPEFQKINQAVSDEDLKIVLLKGASFNPEKGGVSFAHTSSIEDLTNKVVYFEKLWQLSGTNEQKLQQVFELMRKPHSSAYLRIYGVLLTFYSHKDNKELGAITFKQDIFELNKNEPTLTTSTDRGPAHITEQGMSQGAEAFGLASVSPDTIQQATNKTPQELGKDFVRRPLSASLELLSRMHPLAALATIVGLIFCMFDKEKRNYILGGLVGAGIWEAMGLGDMVVGAATKENYEAVKKKFSELTGEAKDRIDRLMTQAVAGFEGPLGERAKSGTIVHAYLFKVMKEQNIPITDILKMDNSTPNGPTFEGTYGNFIKDVIFDNDDYRQSFEWFIKEKIKEKEKPTGGKYTDTDWQKYFTDNPNLTSLQLVVNALYNLSATPSGGSQQVPPPAPSLPPTPRPPRRASR